MPFLLEHAKCIVSVVGLACVVPCQVDQSEKDEDLEKWTEHLEAWAKTCFAIEEYKSLFENSKGAR